MPPLHRPIIGMDGIRRISVQILISPWRNSKWRKPFLALTLLLALLSSSAYFFNNFTPTQAVVQPVGRLYYGDQTNSAMRFQTNTYDFTFNGEVSFTHGGSASLIAHSVAVPAPTRDEIMVGQLKVDGELMVIKGVNGYDVSGDYALAWTNSGTTGAQTCNSATQADCTRAFDIAYEQLSGRAMVVYADTTNQKLYYCYWDGSGWGPQSNCAPTNGTNDLSLSSNGRPTRVAVKSREGTNELIMGVSIDVAGTHEVEAYRWTGSAWTNQTVATSTTNASASALESGNTFDVAWETVSGNAMVVWGASGGAGATNYRYLVNGTWSADLTGPTSVGSNGVMMTMTLVSDPVSNRIGYTYTDDLSDSAPGVWKADGTTMGWTMGNEDASIEANDTGQLYSDVAWENSTSDLMWVSHNSATSVDTEFQTAACSSSGCSFASIDATMPTRGGDDGTFSFLYPSTNSDDIMYLWGDIDRDLSGQHWDGSAWEAAAGGAYEADQSPGTADSTQYHGSSAAFAYIPYSAWSRNWRFYDDETANDPSTGLNSAAENATPTGVDPEEFIRLRINVAELSGQGQTDSRKKLQFTKRCDPNASETACVWSDVADTDNTTAEWRYASRTVDGSAVCADSSHCDDNQTFSTTRLTGSTAAGWYNTDKDAAGGSAMDQAALAITELDFPLKAQNIDSTTYYFRLYDVDQNKPVYREQDNDGNNDCASATCTYPSLTTTAASLTQKATKLESDNGGASYGGSNITTPYTIKIGERVNVRFQVENSGGATYDQLKVQYDKDSNGSWVDVLSGNEIRPVASVSGLNKEASSVNKIGSCTSGYTFGGSLAYEYTAETDSERIGPKRCQELSFTLDTYNAVANVVYRLRLYDVTAGGTISYTQYATFTANSAITDLFSKSRQNVLPTGTTNLRYLQDSAGYTNIASDDSLFNAQNNLLTDANHDGDFPNPEPNFSDFFASYPTASGDVNGDGYDDLVVGCLGCDSSGTTGSGSVYIYLGGSVPDTTADLILDDTEVSASDGFGSAVASSGDLNGDGYDDVLIGCDVCDGSGTTDSGSAYVYYGGVSMDTTADVSIHNPEPSAGDGFGVHVSPEFDDVNGDGYDDVLIGCDVCDGSGTNNSGSAFIYYGGANLDTTADISIHNPEGPAVTVPDAFGEVVNVAGDLNGDGYSDVVIGCRFCDGSGTTDSGSVYVYYGGVSMDTTADVSIHNHEASDSDRFGISLGSGGSINGDIYNDIVVGCDNCDGSGTTDQGSVFVYYGGASMNATVDVSIHDPEPAAVNSDFFGGVISTLKDLNKDNYVDIVVACRVCDNGAGTGDSGSAYAYYGGASMDTTADISINNPEATSNDNFAVSVSIVGDTNGDRNLDVVVGCNACDSSGTTDAGSFYQYNLGTTMNATADITTHTPEATANDFFGYSATSAGDVNGDGYDDVIQGCYACEGLGITDSGLASIYYGGPIVDVIVDVNIYNPEGTSASFARSVGAAGDVNGDGYDDVIVGCPSCDSSGTTDAGTAFIYFGAASMDGTVDITLQNPEPTASDQYAMNVASALDVNGDGYDDVIVSCEACDGSGTTDSGSAFIYYGGSSMNSTVDLSIHNPEATGSDAFGRMVATAGNVNGDIYADVIVGCSLCDGSGTTDSGSAFIYYGGSSMDTTADVSIHNPEATGSDDFGRAIDTALDVNGDGYDDVIVGCLNCDGSGTTDSGSAFIYYGGSSMNSTVDQSIHNPEATGSDNFGHWVANAGDTNGDGYADVIVGCYLCDGSGTSNSGSAFLYFGGIAMDTTADLSIHNPEATASDNFGQRVASAGDLNQDGYADIIVNCYACDGSGTTDSGSLFTYYGGKSADYNIFNFAKKNADNSSTIDITWKGQSTLAAGTKNILLQVYRFGATNAWTTVTTNSSLAADTAGTITGSVTTNLSEYYDGSNITYWRLYQQADSATLGNVLQTQYFNYVFTATNVAISGTVYLSDESTLAASVCDGVTAIVSVRVDGGTATTGTCHDTLATYSITISNPTAGQTVAVYLTSTEKANTIFLSDHASDANMDLYVDHLSLGHKNAGPLVITDLDAYDSDQNNTDMLFDAEDASPDTLIVESGNELHLRTSETFAPGGNVTTPKMHVKGTYTGASENLTINGSGTGTSRPLYIDGGTFTSNSNTTTFTGTSNSDIESTTYNVVQLYPSSGTQTYALRSGTFTANSNLDINNGASLTVDVDTSDPNIVVKGNLTIGASTTYTKSASGTFTFTPTGTKTWTDNTAGVQDIGLVTLGSGASTPVIQLASHVKATTITINSSHELDANGTRNITITGTGSAFVVTGDFRYSTSTVIYTNATSATVAGLNGSSNIDGYYNLQTNGAGTFTLGGATTVNNDLTISAGTLDVASGSNYALTVTGSYSNSGTFTARSGTVTFNSTASGKTLSGTLNGTSAFYKVIFHNASGGGAWTIQNPMLVDTSSGTPAADTLKIGNGTVTVGNGNGDDLLVYGGIDIAVTANETGVLQTMDGLTEGSTITIQVNKDTSTQCANCIVDVGASSGSGAGTLTINENSVLKLIPKSSATASDTGVVVASTGKLNVTGALSLAETASTAIADYDNRETTLCANADFSAGFTSKHVRMTSGLAFGQIYAITGTTVNDGTCDTGTHDSITRANTSTSNVVSETKSVSGVIMSVCVPSIITANNEKIGSYMRDLTGTKGYFQIVDSVNDDASCTGTNDLLKTIAYPDSFSGMTAGDTVDISDGVIPGDNFEIYDFAHVTAEDGVACTATVGQSGEGYISAIAGSDTVIQYGQICNLGRSGTNKTGLSFTGVNGSNANEGVKIDKSLLNNSYYFVLSSITNNSTGNSKGLTNSTITGNQAGLSLDLSTYNTISSNAITQCSGLGVAAIYLFDSNGSNTFSSNRINNNQDGISISDFSNSNTLTNNTINGNGTGISLSSSINNTIVTSNTTNGNTVNGIQVSGIGHQLSSNTSLGNSENGIWFTGDTDSQATSNTANGNGSNGILLRDSVRNVLTSNTANSNTGSGIQLDTDGFGGSKLNVIKSNIANSNGGSGINLSTTSTRNLIQLNSADSNNTAGFNLGPQSYGNIFVGNDADGNGYGLRVNGDNQTTGIVSIGDVFGNVASNTSADIAYIDSDSHDLSLYGTTLASSTEVSGVTVAGSYVFSRKHDNTNGLTKIWGEYAIPTDTAETPQDEDTNKFNYANNLWEKSVSAHNYSGTGDEDTNIAYDLVAGPADLSGGPYVYRLYTKTAGSGASCGSSQAVMDVYRNGTDVGDLTTGSQFTDTNSSVNTKFTVQCGSIPYAVGDTYTFVAWDADNNTAGQKTITMMQDGDTFTAGSGTTLQIKGQTTATNLTNVTHGSGGYNFIIGGTIDAQYYSFDYMGNATSGIGLDLQSGATITNLADGAYANFNNATVGNTYIKVHGSLIGTGAPAKTFANVAFTQVSANRPQYSVTQTATGAPAAGNYWFFSSAGTTCTNWTSCEDSDSDTGDGGSDPRGFLHFYGNVAVSGVVYLTNESTIATSGNGGPCDGTTVLAIRVDGGTAVTGSCSGSDATFSIVVNANSGQTVAIYLTSSMKANTVYLADGADNASMHLYENHLTLGHKNAGPLIITDLDAYDSDQNNTDMLFDAEDSSPDTLVVESGNELHLRSSETFAPAGNVTTPKMHVVGTYTGASENLTLNGSGTGTSRPLYINGGTFTANSNTTTFTGTSNSDIEATTYNVLQLYPSSGTQTYALNSGSLTINSNWDIGNGSTLTVDVDTGDPNIIVKGNLTIGSTVTYTKSATATFTFTPTGTKTWTDSTTSKQDLGLVSLANGSSTPTIQPTTSVKATTINITTTGATHVLDMNGSNTLTLTGTTGTLFTRAGTFTQSTSEVKVASASGTPTFLSGDTTFHKLTIDSAATVINMGSAVTINNVSGAELNVTTGVFNVDANNITGPGSGNGTLTIASSATLCLGGTTSSTTATCNSGATQTATRNMPTFQTYAFDSASNVRYLANVAQTLSATPTYGNLYITPTLTATRIYTFSAGATINGDLNITPTVSSTFRLDFRLGGATTVASGKTTTIDPSGSSSNYTNLDTVSGSNYSFTTGRMVVAVGGALFPRSATFTFNGTTGTLFTYEEGAAPMDPTSHHATWVFNPDASVTLTDIQESTATFYNVSFTPTITDNRTYTLAATPGSNHFSNDGLWLINPSSGSAKTLTINMNINNVSTIVGCGYICDGSTILRTTGSGAGPASSVFDLTNFSGGSLGFFQEGIDIQDNGTLKADDAKITLAAYGGSGTLLSRSGTGVFTADTSTVVMSPDRSTTLTSGTFTGSSALYNLKLSPALSGGAITYTFGSGAIATTGDFDITPTASTGSQSLLVNMGADITVASGKTTTINAGDTNSPTVTLDTRPASTDYNLTTGHLVLGDGTGGADTLDATGSASTITVSGNYTNNGTFTAGSSTVLLNGSSTQTLSGTMTSGSAFYNLTVTNSSGTNASDCERTGFVASVDFAGSATSTNNLTFVTPSSRIEFNDGSTYTFNNINWNGQAGGTEIYFRNSAASGSWLLNVSGTQTAVSYINVSRSDASGGNEIDASDGTNVNCNNNNNWNFGGSPTFEQSDFRFATPNGVDVDYTGAPAENVAYTTTGTSDDFRLRQLIHVSTATLTTSGQDFKLQFGEKTAATCASGVSWADVATGSGVIRYYDAGGRADGDNLTSNAGDPDHSGHTRVYQDYEEANNFTNSVADIPAGQDGEWDFSLINHSAVGGKRYCFQVVESDGTALTAYNQYPEVIIDEELIFSLDTTSKDFGVIQPGANPTDQTTTLTTTTNSSTGYVIYSWSTQALTRGSFTISDWTGTNATPTTFGNGSFGFGYTTNDSSLSGGTADRFTNGGAKYAGYGHTGSGDPVADRTSGPVSGSTDQITYRVAASGSQAAGKYETVIVYIASVTF